MVIPPPASASSIVALEDDSPLLRGSRGRFRSGDHLISDGIHSIVIGGSSRPYLDFYDYPTADALGSILGFWPAAEAEHNTLMVGSPILRTDSRLHYLTYSSLEFEVSGDAPPRVHAEAIFAGDRPGRQARIQTTYSLSGNGILEVISTLRNSGSEPLRGSRFSLHFSADQLYPYETDLYARLHFQLAPKAGHYVAWVDLNRLDEEGRPLAVDLAPGRTIELRYALIVNPDSERLLREVFQLLEVEVETAEIQFDNPREGPFEVIVKDVAGGFALFRAFFDEPLPLRLALPPGTYAVTGNLFPAVTEIVLTVLPGASARCTLVTPERGRVRVAIRDEDGSPLPGKVTFIGMEGTPSPYFLPHDPMANGRYWEETKNSVYPGLSDLTVELAEGAYLVSASRGPEFSAEQVVTVVTADQDEELDFRLQRVVESEGLLAVDLHMHTLRSDGAVTARERVLTLVAEGVEFAVATDHFFRNDYAPDVRALGLERYLATASGSEISIRNPLDYEYTLDFNLYPLAPDEAGWTAAETLSEEVAPIFEATRKRYPNALIQLNHPRNSSWDYFNSYRLDPKSAAAARANFWTGFDVLEVLNGPSPRFNNNVAAVQDWLNLLSRGFFYPAVATSDTHQIDTEEAGYSRTYVYVDDEDIAAVDTGAVIAALKQGHSFVTNGPIVEITANDRYLPGDTVSVPGGRLELGIEVRSAPWIAVDEVRVLVNGEVREILGIEKVPGVVQRFRGTRYLELARDAFVLVEVVGRTSLYPVVQAKSRDGEASAWVRPYAFTNPLFVDIDGNGRYDPPLPRLIRPLPPSLQ